MPENPDRLAFLEYGALMAFAASCRATCRRRVVGCALFNSHKVVVTTGYNGAPAGAPQCDEVGCLIVNGHCARITHAEKNAVLFAGNRCLKGGYSFTTIRPCRDCFDVLVAKEVKYMYYIEDYRNEDSEDYASKICRERNIVLEKLQLDLLPLLQKALDFHQGPGGLLVARNKLTIEEYTPEMMDH
jgi:dCMP deaminase